MPTPGDVLDQQVAAREQAGERELAAARPCRRRCGRAAAGRRRARGADGDGLGGGADGHRGAEGVRAKPATVASRRPLVSTGRRRVHSVRRTGCHDAGRCVPLRRCPAPLATPRRSPRRADRLHHPSVVPPARDGALPSRVPGAAHGDRRPADRRRASTAYLEHHTAPAATREQLARVHSAAYIDADRAARARATGLHYLDPDTALNPHSLDGRAARGRRRRARRGPRDDAASARPRSARCVRPATTRSAGARWASACSTTSRSAPRTRWPRTAVERVAVVDFDVHHGNGTEDIFAGDPRVLMVVDVPVSAVSVLAASSDPAPNMVNVPLRAGHRQRGVSRRRDATRWLPALEAHPAAADPDLGGLRRASRRSARGPRVHRRRLRVGDARARATSRAPCATGASCRRSKAATRCRRSAAARPSTCASSSRLKRASVDDEAPRRSSDRAPPVAARRRSQSARRRVGRCAAAAVPRGRASSTSTAQPIRAGEARDRDQLRVPVSVRVDAVLPAEAARGRSPQRAALHARGRQQLRVAAAASAASATIVAFSAICAHKLAYPTREVSFIRYQRDRSATSGGARHPLLRRPQRLRSGAGRARRVRPGAAAARGDRARARSRATTSSSRSAPSAPSSSTRSSTSTSVKLGSSTAARDARRSTARPSCASSTSTAARRSSADGAGAAIVVERLRKHYGTVEAVNGISFAVRAGTTTALLGGNGAGKTTTLSMLLGVLTPTAGDRSPCSACDMRTQRLAVAAAHELHVAVRRPAEAPDGAREPARVRGPLRRARSATGASTSSRGEFDLGDFLKRPYGKPVGRAAHARIAREGAAQPARGAAARRADRVARPGHRRPHAHLSRGLPARAAGCTMLLASHNMGEVERMCDDVIMLRAGVVVDQGSPAELIARYGRADMEEVFLDIARGTSDEPDAWRCGDRSTITRRGHAAHRASRCIRRPVSRASARRVARDRAPPRVSAAQVVAAPRVDDVLPHGHDDPVGVHHGLPARRPPTSCRTRRASSSARCCCGTCCSAASSACR